MPAELRPLSKRKATDKPNKAKRIKIVPTEVVEEKMKILEQKEKENPDGEEKSVKGDNESDDDLENVGCTLKSVEDKYLLSYRKKDWQKWTKRWTTMVTTRTITLITVKVSMTKMIIWTKANLFTKIFC